MDLHQLNLPSPSTAPHSTTTHTAHGEELQRTRPSCWSHLRCIIRRLAPGTLSSRSSIPFGNIPSLARAIPFLMNSISASGIFNFGILRIPQFLAPTSRSLLVPRSSHFHRHLKHPHPHQSTNCQTATNTPRHHATTPPHITAGQCDWWLLNPALAGRGSESKTWLVEKDVSHSAGSA